jgi:hypothetical protein
MHVYGVHAMLLVLLLFLGANVLVNGLQAVPAWLTGKQTPSENIIPRCIYKGQVRIHNREKSGEGADST